MSEEDKTEFVELTEEGFTIDREALRERLEEEGLEDALEQDDVFLSFDDGEYLNKDEIETEVVDKEDSDE